MEGLVTTVVAVVLAVIGVAAEHFEVKWLKFPKYYIQELTEQGEHRRT